MLLLIMMLGSSCNNTLLLIVDDIQMVVSLFLLCTMEIWQLHAIVANRPLINTKVHVANKFILIFQEHHILCVWHIYRNIN